MPAITLTAFHTPHYEGYVRTDPVPAFGYEQWLGDGYYFWQDEEFAKWWGNEKKCKNNLYRRYIIYKALINIEESQFIDTVFNDEDYYNFVLNIEKFSREYQRKFKKKPQLIEFNEFIDEFNIWGDIKVIRFQDIPENNQLMEVRDFYYKKRIQILVKERRFITNFAEYKKLACI